MLGAIVATAVLLVLGVVLRRQFPFLAAARIPASLIAGTIGLMAWQVMLGTVDHPPAGPAPIDATDSLPEGLANPGAWQAFVLEFEKDSIDHWKSWPGWLIAVVFAGMLLSKSPTRSGAIDRERERRGAGFSPVAREALMVWIIVIGQTVFGLWLVWWWIGPQYGLPHSAAMLIETGFAGGHGTAAAMGTVFTHRTIGLDEGLDLGVLMATTGLVYGLVSGIFWIELGVRQGWVAHEAEVPPNAKSPTAVADQQADLTEGNVRQVETVAPGSDAVDPLLLQLVWLMLAFSIGVGLQWCVDSVAGWIDASGVLVGTTQSGGKMEIEAGDRVLQDRLRVVSIVGSFPLFIYTLFGGAIVRFLIVKTAGERWIDHATISRLVGASMDLLVVAAVATLNLAVVASLWVPMTGLIVAGAVWSTFCLLFLSRKILPRSHWFELGLINFGMSTGTTATGFVLLRVIDPKLRTRAAEHYALAAPLSAPFIGGGMITVGLPLLVLERLPIGISAAVMTAVLLTLVVWGLAWGARQNAVTKD